MGVNVDLNRDNLIDDVMEHIDEIVVIFDKNGIIQKMNSLSDEILPFKRKHIIGRGIDELVEENLVESPIIAEMIKAQKKISRDIVYPNGKVISYTAIPKVSDAGEFEGGVLTGRDVSRTVGLTKMSNRDYDENDSDVEYISASEKIDQIKEIIAKVAPSDASVFILGESGVGKEIIARSVWKQSLRRDKPFVAVNCASIPQELIESELFGYEPGSFTGASKDGKSGLIEHADGGTLFLDEIGELPLETQKKLLRVLQEKTIMRIGGVNTKKVDVRFVSATNKTLTEIKDPSIFRQDLYYRLSVIPLTIPPLRARKEDILPIAYYYIDRFNKKYGKKVILSDKAKYKLLENNWPGNIRELRNVIERLVILSQSELVGEEQMDKIINLDYLQEYEDDDDDLNVDNGAIGGAFIENINLIQNDYNSREMNSNSDCYLGGNYFAKSSDENIDGNTPEGKNRIEEMIEANKNFISEHPIIVNSIISIDEAHRLVEQEIIQAAVDKYGNITKAAEKVGINPSTVYRKMKTGYIKIEVK